MKTQNRYKLIIYVLTLSISWAGFTQDDSSTNAFQLSFVYPLGTNGKQSPEINNNFSLNLIAGYTGGVNVLEVGGVYNINSSHVKGVQLSGFGNTVKGDVNGVQVSGFINTTTGTIGGAQLSGFLNLNKGDTRGATLGGFLNISQNSTGVQAAGFSNISKGTKGAQVSGFMNLSDDVNGVQVSGFLNSSGDVNGAQVSGFLNKAKTVKGVQTGVINIADSVASGAQVGLINISKKNGFISVGLESDDAFRYRLAFRSGMDYFYTVLVAGLSSSGDYWSMGAGVGSRIFLSKQKNVFVNPELRWEHINEGNISYDDFNHLTKLNLNFGYQILPKLYVTGGPSLNYYVTNELDANGLPVINLSDNHSYDELRDSKRHQMWFGYNIGIGFKF